VTGRRPPLDPPRQRGGTSAAWLLVAWVLLTTVVVGSGLTGEATRAQSTGVGVAPVADTYVTGWDPEAAKDTQPYLRLQATGNDVVALALVTYPPDVDLSEGGVLRMTFTERTNAQGMIVRVYQGIEWNRRIVYAGHLWESHLGESTRLAQFTVYAEESLPREWEVLLPAFEPVEAAARRNLIIAGICPNGSVGYKVASREAGGQSPGVTFEAGGEAPVETPTRTPAWTPGPSTPWPPWPTTTPMPFPTPWDEGPRAVVRMWREDWADGVYVCVDAEGYRGLRPSGLVMASATWAPGEGLTWADPVCVPLSEWAEWQVYWVGEAGQSTAFPTATAQSTALASPSVAATSTCTPSVTASPSPTPTQAPTCIPLQGYALGELLAEASMRMANAVGELGGVRCECRCGWDPLQ